MDKIKSAIEWLRSRARVVFETPSDRCFYCLAVAVVAVFVASLAW